MNLFLSRVWLPGLPPFLIFPAWPLYSGYAQLLTVSQRFCIILYIMHWLPTCPKLLELVFTPAFYSSNLDVCLHSVSECASIETSPQQWINLPPMLHPSLLLVVLRIVGIHLMVSFPEWQSWSGLELERVLKPGCWGLPVRLRSPVWM